jgi:threonine/homoserine/homoserine lactone efflux protein
MVSVGQIMAFAVAAFVMIVIPGPSVLFVVGRALAHGRRTALASVVGNAVGVQVVAVCVALGVGTLVERSALAFTMVRLAGAAYLVWLGIHAIRHRRGLASALAAAAPGDRSRRKAMLEGFVVGIANPKAVILFAAILPEFVNRQAGHVPAQMLMLSLVSFAIALISDSMWSLVASAVRAWLARSPRRLGLVGGAGGLAMIGLGLSVAATGRKNLPPAWTGRCRRWPGRGRPRRGPGPCCGSLARCSPSPSPSPSPSAGNGWCCGPEASRPGRVRAEDARSLPW